jgi:cytochrome P450
VQALHWARRPIDFMEECQRQYGDAFTIRLPGQPNFVFISDPEAIREIFTGDPERLHAGEANAPALRLLGQHSLLVLDGQRHLRERRLMLPPFHGERMQAYGEVMREITDHSIDTWPVERPFSIHSYMQGITLDVILRTVFGLEDGAQQTRLRDLLVHLLDIQTAGPLFLFFLLPFFQYELGGLTPWGQLLRRVRGVDAMLYAEIARRRQQGGAGRDDVLSMLIEARDEQGEPMTDVELRDEMITLLLAGHETTATTLAWVFHRILRRADVIERLGTELARVTGGEPLNAAHVGQLEYLDATIKETLRLNPIIPVVARRLTVPMRIGRLDLPAGTVVAPCIYLTHRRPDLWPDPERFDPERFIGAKPNPYGFFPFGGGVRRCLGMAFALYEAKVVIAQVLSRVVLRAAPGTTVRLVRRGITFAPSAGMPVVVTARAA